MTPKYALIASTLSILILGSALLVLNLSSPLPTSPPPTTDILKPVEKPVVSKNSVEVSPVSSHFKHLSAEVVVERLDFKKLAGADPPAISSASNAPNITTNQTAASDIAIKYSDFLQQLDGPKVICRALWMLYANSKIDSCTKSMTNSENSIHFEIVIKDSSRMLYAVELLGKSSFLALKSPGWVERHRIWVSIGFDAQLEPTVTVLDFEPMLRTTPDLFPVEDELFEYIDRKHDSLLIAFQDTIKQAIKSAIDEAHSN